ncbi:hypothetical protein FPZ54_07355 [Sphingomonas suaedae]|uniref:Uncharacterized protein n=1 Tax=Sphingomonas suaedae TaxID=2599297 RepID=A0A518REG8_9SPHN|nr:hypothetical protein [Sphingomonas suaedae]QDX25856.1 hypothetical protein FPZ54_07355 [Sphingomonas suaedae]
MKNVQIIDDADNATFSVFQASDNEFALIFPGDCDMELVEHFVDRVGEEAAGRALNRMWSRPILKRDVKGIHGTLFYGRGDHIPASKREVDWADDAINSAQRDLFLRHR